MKKSGDGIHLLKLMSQGNEDIRAERYSRQDELFARIKARLDQRAAPEKHVSPLFRIP